MRPTLRFAIGALLLTGLVALTRQSQTSTPTKVAASSSVVKPFNLMGPFHPHEVPVVQTPETTSTTTIVTPPPHNDRSSTRAARSAPRRPPTVAPTKPPVVTASTIGGVWACIRQHESGGNYARNSGNGYYGAYQFSPTTWWATMARLGYGTYQHRVYSGSYPRADTSPPAIQDQAAGSLQAVAGWGQWPQTSRMCGVR